MKNSNGFNDFPPKGTQATWPDAKKEERNKHTMFCEISFMRPQNDMSIVKFVCHQDHVKSGKIYTFKGMKALKTHFMGCRKPHSNNFPRKVLDLN